jgi:hypothetical protein
MQTAPLSSAALRAFLPIEPPVVPFLKTPSISQGTDIRITSINKPQNETCIVADPNNANIIVGGFNDYSLLSTGYGGNGVCYSHDGGATWVHHSSGVPLLPGFTRLGGDPCLQFDSQGRVYYGHLGVGTGTNSFKSNNGIFVSRSDDGGVTWTAGVAVASNTYPGFGFVNFEDKPFLTADFYASSVYKDRVYVTWTRFYSGTHPNGGTGGGDIMFSYSSDGGATWSTPVRLSDSTHLPANQGTGTIGSSYVQGSEPEVAPNGDVYVVFWFGGRVEVMRSTDGGATFAMPTEPFGTSYNSASVWSPLPNESFRVNPYPNIEADPTRAGYVYVVAADDPNNSSSGDGANIVFARSTNYGAGWGSTITLNDDGGTYNQIFPWMAVSKKGEIQVIWYDTRNDPGNHNLDVYGTYSIDGGASFCPNFRVTDVSFNPNTGQFSGNSFFGDYNGFGDGGNNTFHALWTDARNNEQEVYYDRISGGIVAITCPPGAVIPTGSTVPVYTLSGFTIKNEGTCNQAFTYNVTEVGPATLTDLGNPASLSGTTPVLIPGGTYSPPNAGLSIPAITSYSVEKVYYEVSPTSGGWPDTCTTIITIEPGVAVAFTGFEGSASSDAIKLVWSISDMEGVQGFNVYRSDAGREEFSRVNASVIPPGERGVFTDRNVVQGRSYTYKIGVKLQSGEDLSRPLTVSAPVVLYALEQNYPNPFKAVTSIRFVLPSNERVAVRVYDLQGKLVRTLADGMFSRGPQTVSWDGRDSAGRSVGSGLYFYQLKAGKFRATKKMILLR